MRSDYIPNERIIARAAKLWRKMIEQPVFDNGDNSLTGFVAQGLAGAGAASNPLTVKQLDGFEAALQSLLLRKLTHGAEDPKGDEGYYQNSLHVDYGADATLRRAADEAGIKGDMTRFPWKTNMFLWSDYLYVAAGYGASAVYHYPLDGGRWLVTQLAGEDISKVIDLVEGRPATFFVEPEEVPCVK